MYASLSNIMEQITDISVALAREGNGGAISGLHLHLSYLYVSLTPSEATELYAQLGKSLARIADATEDVR